jgi:uncharacterized protein YjbI with pentapeptide repeats
MRQWLREDPMSKSTSAAKAAAVAVAVFSTACGELPTATAIDGSILVAEATSGTQGGFATGKMYWTDRSTHKIQRANLDGTNVEDLITGLNDPINIALDVAAGKMYWGNQDSPPPVKIQRANLDGTNVEDLVTTGVSDPIGIALDVAAGKMYWADVFRPIRRANLDGTNVEDLVPVTMGLNRPFGIALDVAAGKIYWTDQALHNIQRANLDGTNVEELVTGLGDPTHPINPHLTGPTGIALDLTSSPKKIYWIVPGTRKIQRANLDGTNVEDLVATGATNYAGIALDVAGGKMYFTQSNSFGGRTRRANLDGTNVEDLVTTGLNYPFGVALDVQLQLSLDIDIKPGTDPGSINPKSSGLVPVAILGSDVFDVTDVDVTTLTFGPAGASPAHDLTDPVTQADHVRDVKLDGFTDLVSHYRQKETGLTASDTEGCISGAMISGTPIDGCDAVRVLDR